MEPRFTDVCISLDGSQMDMNCLLNNVFELTLGDVKIPFMVINDSFMPVRPHLML